MGLCLGKNGVSLGSCLGGSCLGVPELSGSYLGVPELSGSCRGVPESCLISQVVAKEFCLCDVFESFWRLEVEFTASLTR